MKSLLLVAAGGAAGCVLRYATGLLVAPQTIAWRFPVATFVVNVLGCLSVRCGLAALWAAVKLGGAV